MNPFWKKHGPKVVVAVVLAVSIGLFFCIRYIMRPSAPRAGAQPPPVEAIDKAVAVHFTLMPMDSLLYGFGKGQADALGQALETNYPVFYPVFVREIMGIPPTVPPAQVAPAVSEYATNDSVRVVHRDVQKKFGNQNGLRTELQAAFQNYKHFFARKPIPNVVTFTAPFMFPAVSVLPNGDIALGLHMFMGHAYRYYPTVENLYHYQYHRLEPYYIAKDVVQALLEDHFYADQTSQDLLHQMVHAGQMAYALKQVLPTTPDSVIFGFTAKQMAWVEGTEPGVWSALVQRKALYSREPLEIGHFMGDGPQNRFMPKESPAMVGPWVGYRIVAAWMQKHPDTSLETLLKMQDANKVLRESEYRPE